MTLESKLRALVAKWPHVKYQTQVGQSTVCIPTECKRCQLESLLAERQPAPVCGKPIAPGMHEFTCTKEPGHAGECNWMLSEVLARLAERQPVDATILDLAQEILKPHWPVVRNMEENEARQREVERIINVLKRVAVPALAERQEPPALTARENVATQMADDILLRIAKRYANCEVNIYPDCPELTPVEAVLRCAKEEGFHLTNAAAPSSGTGENR